MKQSLLCILCLLALLSPVLGGDGWADSGPANSPSVEPWQAVEGPYGGSVTALALSPNYAQDHMVFAGLRGDGVYRTINWGQSWQPASPEPWAVVDLAISPAFASDGTLFASQGLWTTGYEVHCSDDEGETWQNVTPAWSALPNPPLLAISPDFENDGTLYVLGGDQTYLSTDRGDTFVQAGGWFASHHVAELAFSPAYASDATLFALVPADGLYKSVDGGTNWDPTGLSGDLSTIAISPNYATDQMLLAVGAIDGQLQVSTDGGATWAPDGLHLDPGGQHTLCFSPSYGPGDQLIMAVSSTDPGPYRTLDGGSTWAPSGWYDPGASYLGGFVGGGVYALALAPAGIWDPAGYAGTSTGLYHSNNRGENWYQGNDGLPRLTVRALAVAPGDPDTLLAGTSYFDHQRFDSTIRSEYDGSLQLSTDGGRSWHDVSGPLDRVNGVAFSPTFASDGTAFAVAGTLGQHGYYNGGVYRSFDGGANWDEVLSNNIYRALAVSPSFATDRTVWVSAFTYSDALGIFSSHDGGDVWTSLAPDVHAQVLAPSPNYAQDGTLFAGTADAGLQRSTDSGASWSQVLSHAVTALIVSPAYGASQTLYAAARESPSIPCDIYRSTNGGDTWQLLDTGIPDWAGDVPLTVSVLTFAYDGSVLAGVYYGHEMEEGAIYRSTDGGGNWEQIGYLWHHQNVFALESQPSSSLTFYAGTDIGLWQLDVPQGGPAEPGTWESNGPRGGRADALAISPEFASDGVALAGTGTMGRLGTAWGLGIFRSTDEGQTWQPATMDTGGIGSSTAIYDYAFSPDFAADQTVFAGTWGGLFKSTDGGEGWQQVYRAFFGPPGSITEVAVAPDYATSGHLMGGSPWGILYVSRDGGRNWTADSSLGVVSRITYSPDFGSDATAFASGYPSGDGHVFRTTDGAASWTPVLTQGICSLAISPEFGTDGTIFAGSDALYISHDWGTTWISVTLPMEVPAACPLAISPAFGTDQTLFTATAEGLYRSDDGGMTWNHVPGYTGPAIRALVISPDWPTHPVMLIGGGEGVYRTADGGDTWTMVPGMTTLSTEPLAQAADQHSLVAGAYQYGIYGSDDGGGNWSPLGLQEAEISRFVDVAILPNWPTDGTMYAALGNTQSIGAGIYRSADGGANWEQVHGGQYVYRNALAISPQYAADQTVYAAVGGSIWGSYDGGDTWSMVGDWPSGIFGAGGQVALPPGYPSDGTIFAAGGEGFWRLPPGATTWEPSASSSIMDAGVHAFAVSPNYAQDQTLLAAVGWYDPVSGSHYSVLRSVDGGVHWESIGMGLPYAEVRYIGFSPYYAVDRTVYLTCEDQLYRSVDGGFRWTAVGPAPDTPSLYEMVVDRQGGVYVTSGAEYSAAGNGAWHYTTPAQDILVNGGFEVDSGWELPGTPQPAAYSDRVAFDGGRSMRVGIDNRGVAQAAYSSARQVISLPADTISATLQVHVYPVSGETVAAAAEEVLATDATTAAGDAQYLLLLDPDSGAILETLFWQLSNAQSWQTHTFDLTAYAGNSIRLHLGVYNDAAGGQTGMYVDNVSLLVADREPGLLEHQRYLPIIFRNAE